LDSRTPGLIEQRIDPSQTLGDAGLSEVSSPSFGSLGASCVSATECSSDFCVDGVCCETACDGVC
jgi:hypothetical protein